MATRQYRAVEYVCDAPDCKSWVAVEATSPPTRPVGYSGVARVVTDTYASGNVPWYACSPEHLQLAIETVLEDA